MSDNILSVGYEGMTIESFVSRLRVRDVRTVIDVRLTPLSRKKGFSKTALTSALAEAGIGYLHLPALGNPKDNREGFASTETPAGAHARARFTDLLDGERAFAAIDRIVEASEQHAVAVLCFEADELHCHRHEVLEAVALRRADLVPAGR